MSDLTPISKSVLTGKAIGQAAKARKVAMAKATVRRRAARWRRLRELLGAASSRGGETEELWNKFKE